MSQFLSAAGVGLVLIGLNLNYFAAHKWDEHHLTGIAASMLTAGGIAVGVGTQI